MEIRIEPSTKTLSQSIINNENDNEYYYYYYYYYYGRRRVLLWALWDQKQQ
jgi:hypothetical protein